MDRFLDAHLGILAAVSQACALGLAEEEGEGRGTGCAYLPAAPTHHNPPPPPPTCPPYPAQGAYVSPRCLNLTLQYLNHALPHAGPWKRLKPHVPGLLAAAVLPAACFSDVRGREGRGKGLAESGTGLRAFPSGRDAAGGPCRVPACRRPHPRLPPSPLQSDAELWAEDPHEYVRQGNDVLAELYSPKAREVWVRGVEGVDRGQVAGEGSRCCPPATARPPLLLHIHKPIACSLLPSILCTNCAGRAPGPACPRCWS